jgi:LCP family protein required for cell wall assembly
MAKHNIEDIKSGKKLPQRYSSYSPASRPVPVAAKRQPLPAEKEQKPKKLKRFLSRLALFVLVFAIVLGLILAIWDGRNISAAEHKMFNTGNLLELVNSSSLKGQDVGRVNILLVGYSVDDPGHPGATLTDSLILLSMGTASHTGYMLSIPRDLYVQIPGNGYGKINEAYQDGGIGLLEQVITSNFAQPIDYYALINYSTVRDTTNALGGIAVNITSSDPRGLYDPNISPHDGGPLKLSNGLQTLDGQTALNLTRARGDAYGSYGFAQADFDRTEHQQQVLAAIKARLNWKLILNPRKNSQILNAIASNVKTDISASGARSVFNLFNNIPATKLQSVSLRNLNGKNYLSSYTTSFGQSALIPSEGINDYSAIVAAITQLNQ